MGHYICSFALDSEEILMSLSFSPSSEYLLVGVRSNEIFGCFLKIPKNRSQAQIAFNRTHPKWIHSARDSFDDDSSDNFNRKLFNDGDDDEVHSNADMNSEQDSSDIVMLKRSLSNPDVISYLKWSARSGDGIIIGYKTYQLRCLVRSSSKKYSTNRRVLH